MSLSKRFHPFLVLTLPLGLFLSQCGKKEETPAPGSTAVTPSAPAPKPPTLADHAGKLGFAAKLPASTELYLGTTQLKTHLEALKKSAYWKDLDGLIQDKMPAPTAGDKSQEMFKKLWGDDIFIAGGAGFAQEVTMIKELNQLYNEMNFKVLMSGSTAKAADPEAKPNPLAMFQSLLTDATYIERFAGLAARFELPPLLLGMKVANPSEMMKELFNEKMLSGKSGNIKLTDLKTSDGFDFKTITVDMSALMPESQKKDMLDKLPKDMPENTRQTISKLIDDLRTKKLLFAVGAVGDHLILACGKNLDHLKFTEDPATSLLAKPELAPLMPFAGKNLCALTYASSATLTAMNDPQPIIPMLRGVIGAMKESEMFREMAGKLDTQLTELAPLESKVYGSKWTNFTGIAWWDKGVHMESFGGQEARFMQGDKALNYSGLINKPGVLFGMAYHRNEGYEKDVLAWLEKLTTMLYGGAQELVKAGVAGPEGGQQFAMFEQVFLPFWKKFYQADKDMTEKGFGSEQGVVIDMNGKMPTLPMLPPEAKGMKFPRITSINEVTNRAEVDKAWTIMSESMNGLSAALGGGASSPDKPPLFALPDPINSEKNGVTTYFYGMPFFAGDLLPCASINDKLLILSSSKDAAEGFAGELSKPSTEKITGLYWRFDVSVLTELVASAAKLAPNQKPEQAKEIKDNLKWLKPFKAMQGHTFQDKGQWRTTLDWEILDVVSFD
ncbi:hypothetical protein BH11VER1_BH11VER1_25030 [soil metagenome]